MNTLVKKCEICFLYYKIKKHRRNIEAIREELIYRSNRFHGGRLEIEDTFERLSENDRRQIYNIKREIVSKK